MRRKKKYVYRNGLLGGDSVAVATYDIVGVLRGELMAPTPNVVHHALAQSLAVLGDASVRERSPSDTV